MKAASLFASAACSVSRALSTLSGIRSLVASAPHQRPPSRLPASLRTPAASAHHCRASRPRWGRKRSRLWRPRTQRPSPSAFPQASPLLDDASVTRRNGGLLFEIWLSGDGTGGSAFYPFVHDWAVAG